MNLLISLLSAATIISMAASSAWPASSEAKWYCDILHQAADLEFTCVGKGSASSCFPLLHDILGLSNPEPSPDEVRAALEAILKPLYSGIDQEITVGARSNDAALAEAQQHVNVVTAAAGVLLKRGLWEERHVFYGKGLESVQEGGRIGFTGQLDHPRVTHDTGIWSATVGFSLVTQTDLSAWCQKNICQAPQTLELKPEYHNGSVTIEHLSTACNLDGFRMPHSAARKSADFWYFDVFSASTNQTLNIVFFNSGDFAQYPHPLALQVSGVYPNGTDFYYEALANEGVTITNGPDGIFGEWRGLGSFTGSSLQKPDVEYRINIDSAELGITGSIHFKAIAPPRYPCATSDAVGASQTLFPGLYWANAVPDADTTVNLTVRDTDIKFEDGIGYHDKNWGNKSIIDVPRYWDWGHARLGPYSVVWYNLLDYMGSESRRAYVVKDGEILLLSCATESLEVRQKGGKATWPPTTGLLETEGITVRYTLEDGQVLTLDLTTEFIVRDEKGAYQRANAHVKGGIVGREQPFYNCRLGMDNTPTDPLPDAHEPDARPTHRLQEVKVGDSGVQLLVSTKDHLYDARNIEAGRQSWQVIGSWEEGSVQELGKILAQREATLSRDNGETARFGATYGTGQALGSSELGRGRQVVIRQE
ncbi:Tyrosinase family protein asqI [Paramyrothecium foliicola]|nr:Tyrosinase family protein asqI [Paramyrothecium foliicola]